MTPTKLPLIEIVKAYSAMVYTSFGGPQAHIALFLHSFVETKKWLPESIFVELFAIAQSLPGPASTQLAYAIGVVKGGPIGGIVAFLIWSVPCAIIMALLGIAVSSLQSLPTWLIFVENGLVSAAVGLVALAAFKLGSKLLVEPITILVGTTSAALALNIRNFPWLFPLMMIGGGVATLLQDGIHRYFAIRKSHSEMYLTADFEEVESDANVGDVEQPVQPPHDDFQVGFSYSSRWGYVLFGLWASLLAISILIRALVQVRAMNIFGTMYFVGSIIFGGGPVVIPLLQGYLIDSMWMTNQEFLIGLALINVMPGPNFNIAAYCGAVAMKGNFAFLGAALGYLGIFLPGLLLMSALLPLWREHRNNAGVQSVFKGINAAAVGLVFAAVYILSEKAIIASNGLTRSLFDYPLYVSVASFSMVLTGFINVPAPASILAGGITGLIHFATTRL